MFEVDVKNVMEGRRRGPARVWGSDDALSDGDEPSET